MVFFRNFIEWLFTIRIFIKIGFLPFHAWVLIIIKFIPYKLFFYFLNISKLIPMLILFQVNNLKFIVIFIFLNLIIVFYYGINSTKLKIILFISSLRTLNTFLMISNYKIFIFINILYIIFIYSFLNLIIFLYKENSQIYSKIDKLSLTIIIILILSIRGIPPFFIFWIKVIIIEEIFNTTKIFFFLLNSIGIFYTYIRFSIIKFIGINFFNYSISYSKISSLNYLNLYILFILIILIILNL